MDARERRLAEARRAVEQNVVERFAALLRRRDEHLEVLLDLLLPDVFPERARAQRVFDLRILRHVFGRDHAVFKIKIVVSVKRTRDLVFLYEKRAPIPLRARRISSSVGSAESSLATACAASDCV